MEGRVVEDLLRILEIVVLFARQSLCAISWILCVTDHLILLMISISTKMPLFTALIAEIGPGQ